MTECVDGSVFIASLFLEIWFGHGKQCSDLPIEIITDNHSLCDAISSRKPVSEKRLRIDISAVKKALEKCEINKIVWVNAEKQLADCLTKNGASPFKLLEVLNSNCL